MDIHRQISITLFLVLALTMVQSMTGCASTGIDDSSEPVQRGSYGPTHQWQASDLASGPTAIVKGVVAVPLCAMRLTADVSSNVLNSEESGGSKTADVLLWPPRAVVDGVFTGVAYVLGGVVDTLSGGALGVVEEGTGKDEPNSDISCVLSGDGPTD